MSPHLAKSQVLDVYQIAALPPPICRESGRSPCPLSIAKAATATPGGLASIHQWLLFGGINSQRGESEDLVPDLTQLVALGSIVYTIVNLVRYARDTDWSSVWSQVLAWLAGIVATLVVAHTALANAFSFSTKDLAQIGFGSQVLVGLAAASTISIVYQFKKAVDTGKNAVVPSLLPNNPGKQASAAEAAARSAPPPS